MSMRRPLQGLLLLAGFSISACTAILVPDASDDNVDRCNTSADCPEIDDNRYVAICTSGEDQPDNSDQVCSSDFAEINCGETVYSGDHPLPEAYDDADKAKASYTNCDPDADYGKRGCPPTADTGSCNDGLVENQDGICDTSADPDIPAINAGDVGLGDIAGQDVADQFCRSYFCDERFVCDRSLGTPACVVCNSDDPYGEGGCGTLYIKGEPSSFYTTSESGEWNCDGNEGTDAVEFGPAPSPDGG